MSGSFRLIVWSEKPDMSEHVTRIWTRKSQKSDDIVNFRPMHPAANGAFEFLGSKSIQSVCSGRLTTRADVKLWMCAPTLRPTSKRGAPQTGEAFAGHWDNRENQTSVVGKDHGAEQCDDATVEAHLHDCV